MDQLTISELLKLANMPQVLESPAIVDSSVVDPDSGSWRYRIMVSCLLVDGRVGGLSDSEPEGGNPVVP